MYNLNMFDDKVIYSYFTSDSKDAKSAEELTFINSCKELGIVPKFQDSGRLKLPFESIQQFTIYNSLYGPSTGVHIQFPDDGIVRTYETTVREYTKLYVANHHLLKGQHMSPDKVSNYVDNLMGKFGNKIEEIRQGLIEESVKFGERNNKKIGRNTIDDRTSEMEPKAIITEGPRVRLTPEDMTLSNIFLAMWHTNNIIATVNKAEHDKAQDFVCKLNRHNAVTIMNMRDNTYFYNTKHRLPDIEDDFYISSR